MCEHEPMRAVVQRVTSAEVRSRVAPGAEFEVVGRIGTGLCVLVGVTHTDERDEADRLVTKLAGLRVFDDADGVMNVRRARRWCGLPGRQPVHAVRRHPQGSPAELDACRTTGPRRTARRTSRCGPGGERGHGRDRSVPNRDARRARQRRAGHADDRGLIRRRRRRRVDDGTGPPNHTETPATPVSSRMTGASPSDVYQVVPARSSHRARARAARCCALRSKTLPSFVDEGGEARRARPGRPTDPSRSRAADSTRPAGSGRSCPCSSHRWSG